jgi:hypothetical protein
MHSQLLLVQAIFTMGKVIMVMMHKQKAQEKCT